MGKFGPDQVVREHFDRLRAGISSWNAWRTQSPETVPGLGGQQLAGFDLSGANLRGAFLFGADLSKCNLQDCDLRDAVLQAANLRGALVHGCKLDSANLTVADLRNLDLRRSSLKDTHFEGAKMEGVNLEGQVLRACDFRRANLARANLRNVNLRRVKFDRADLRASDLSQADLTEAVLREATLAGAKLPEAYISLADLGNADFSYACLDGAKIRRSNLTDTNLERATLRGASLDGSMFVRTNLRGADLSHSSVHGTAVWDVITDGARQDSLRITPTEAAAITVDDIEVAQFIYLMLSNSKIRNIIDTITSKAVLVLGRFTENRKPMLEAIARELRIRNLLPILFDFEKPNSRDLAETIQTLAGISRCVVVDLTDARSVPQELSFIIPHFPSLPVQPILSDKASCYAMFEHFERYPWVRKTWVYSEDNPKLDQLFSDFGTN